jgi:uncharacterized protein YjbJ (UPF0337 family)
MVSPVRFTVWHVGYARHHATRKKAGTVMDNSNTDQAKGRIKQAVGDLTDDRDMKREGKADEAAGKAKEAVGNMKDKADDLIDRARDKTDRSV